MAVAKKVRPTFPKTKFKAPKEEDEAPKGPRPGLAITDTPGVFRNKAGVLVNGSGIALTFKELKKKDTERLKEVTGDAPDTPADLLRTLAFDPRLPLVMRADLAHKAAPFFTAKKVAIQGGGAGAPPIEFKGLEHLSQAQLDKLEKLTAEIEALVSQGATK